jgi:hypothetical protein
MHRSEIRLFPPCLGSRVLHAAVLVWVQPEMRYGLTVACGGDGAKEKVLMSWDLGEHSPYAADGVRRRLEEIK